MINDMNPDREGILNNPRVAKFAIGFLGVAIAFLAVQMLATLHSIDESPNAQQNIISVNGEGKVSATPNLAMISFTVSEDADTGAAAQDAAAKKTNAALAVLKNLKIADADIQTSSYNVYPDYPSNPPCVYNQVNGIVMPCPIAQPTIIGYTASQTVTVKLHDVNSVGDVVSALGTAGVSNLNGPDFSIENPDALQAEARADAIKDARSKADALAKDLGVHIVRVVNYSEGGGAYPMYAKDMAMSAGGTAVPTVPQVPTGQNDITIDVSVTYEIR